MTVEVDGHPVKYENCPVPRMAASVEKYIEHGVSGGGFMTALFSGDLFGAFSHADEENLRALKKWCQFLYNDLPSGSWGSPSICSEWMKTQQSDNKF